MYSITELANIFKTTRKTIYNKLETPQLHQYIKETKKGKRLIKEGFNELQLVMSKSKVTNTKQEVNTTYTDSNHNYINSLETQIEELKKDKEKLYSELNNKNKQLEKAFNLINITNEKVLLLTEEQVNNNIKKTWWKFWNKK